jgi:hypothetical protein
MRFGKVDVVTALLTMGGFLAFEFCAQLGVTMRAMFYPDGFLGPAHKKESYQE